MNEKQKMLAQGVIIAVEGVILANEIPHAIIIQPTGIIWSMAQSIKRERERERESNVLEEHVREWQVIGRTCKANFRGKVVDDCTSQGRAQHLTLASKPRSLNSPKMTQGGACMIQGI